MKLQDKDYEDENGRRLERNEIDCIGTFTYIVDGFFEWECGACNHEHKTRGFSINGTVYTCYQCKKKNLLLRTDINYVKQVFRNAERRDADQDKRARAALKYLGQAITALGE